MPADRVRELSILVKDTLAGSLTHNSQDRLEVTYRDDWRIGDEVTPLSLSMPVAQRSHPDSVVRPYLKGLLPDNDDVLNRWGRQYQVSATNPFALLTYVGEDCAGAVQFVRPDRLQALLAGDGEIEWLDEDAVAQRVRALRKDPTAWHSTGITGQFSLAGAQAKTALFYDAVGRRWGLPSGRIATTHILKPAITGFDDHDLNEHLCLMAARIAGLSAAASHVEAFASERVIVIERYDRRYEPDGRLIRIHQEDVCQALGLPPALKYQNEGGPSAEQVIALLRKAIPSAALANREIDRFVAALAFNWIIAGTDAHAKNYSVLLEGSQVWLAPLYDLASALPYDDMYLPKLSMAMRIGGEYRLAAVSGRHWRRFAETNRLDPDAVVAQIDDLTARVTDAFAAAATDPTVRELGSDLPDRLAAAIAKRAVDCRQALGR